VDSTVGTDNPCSEIVLEGSGGIMSPEWQILLMNDLRRRQGLRPVSEEERKKLVEEHAKCLG
jgi:hypothetical protein